MVIDYNETITAVSTPPGPGGIGIIKISGRDALPIARSVFRRTGSRDRIKLKDVPEEHPFKPNIFLLGNIFNPENEQIIDEVLLVYMKAPKSYTREDVVEIQAHSGPVVLQSILELIIKKGARPAEPGEFTKRAFLNGRIDLTQAEAVAEIIHSKTKKSLEVAVRQAEGYLGKTIRNLRESLQQILTLLEAEIDFSEEIEENVPEEEGLVNTIEDVVLKMEVLIKGYNDGAVLRDGLKVCIAGKPNVGKSSLMNSFLRKDRAIVTPLPGTTRDAIEEMIDIGGIPVIITDTAGIHGSEDQVENIGMVKAWEYIDNADIIIFMVDASTGIDRDDEFIFEKIKNKKIIITANKSDLVEESFSLEMPEIWKGLPAIKISALYHQGIDQLKNKIQEDYVAQSDLMENKLIPNIRQKGCLEKSHESAMLALEGLKDGFPPEAISIDIKEALNYLGEILGTTTDHDILSDIFNRFCIGK